MVKFTFPFFVTLAIRPVIAWWGKFFLRGLVFLRLSQAAAAAAAAAPATAPAFFLSLGFVHHRLVLSSSWCLIHPCFLLFF